MQYVYRVPPVCDSYGLCDWQTALRPLATAPLDRPDLPELPAAPDRLDSLASPDSLACLAWR